MTTFEKFINFLTGNTARIESLEAENIELRAKLSKSEQAAIELRKISLELDALLPVVATDPPVDEGLPEQGDAGVEKEIETITEAPIVLKAPVKKESPAPENLQDSGSQ